MKTVFTNAMCAHVWAQQSQSFGRSGSMSFRDSVLYSYRTPIAVMAKGADGQRVALVTCNTYSMTTSSKHMPAMRRALPADVVTFYVPKVIARHESEHKVNAGHLSRAYIAERARLMRCPADSYSLVDSADRNPLTGDILPTTVSLTRAHSTLRALATTYADYCKAFGLVPDAIDWQRDADDAIARRDRLLNDPKRQARMAAARARREAVELRQRQEQEARDAERIAAWLAGDPNTRMYGYTRSADKSALLRINGDNVETSLGASAPVAHVRRALEIWRHFTRYTEAWTRDKDSTYGHARLGHFTMDSIDKEGNVRAGCHFIAADVVRGIAAKLGA